MDFFCFYHKKAFPYFFFLTEQKHGSSKNGCSSQNISIVFPFLASVQTSIKRAKNNGGLNRLDMDGLMSFFFFFLTSALWPEICPSISFLNDGQQKDLFASSSRSETISVAPNPRRGKEKERGRKKKQNTQV